MKHVAPFEPVRVNRMPLEQDLKSAEILRAFATIINLFAQPFITTARVTPGVIHPRGIVPLYFPGDNLQPPSNSTIHPIFAGLVQYPSGNLPVRFNAPMHLVRSNAGGLLLPAPPHRETRSGESVSFLRQIPLIMVPKLSCSAVDSSTADEQPSTIRSNRLATYFDLYDEIHLAEGMNRTWATAENQSYRLPILVGAIRARQLRALPDERRSLVLPIVILDEEK